MQRLEKYQIIALLCALTPITYFGTGIICIVKNGYLRKIHKLMSWDFTAVALLNNFDYIWTSLGMMILLDVALVIFLFYYFNQESLFGNARFATNAEIKKAGLYGDKGIIVGKQNGKLLRFGGQQFVALGAPTRSGKGVGIVIPNLLDWPESAVVQDIKQECFDITSKYRAEKLGNEVYLFNPFSRRTHRYNPLSYINMSGDNADGELTDFANILYPLSGDSTTQFFNQLAQNLFIGLCYLANDLLTKSDGLLFLRANNIDLSFTLFGILELSEGFTFTVSRGDEEGDPDEKMEGFESTVEWLKDCGIASDKTIKRLQSYFAIDSDNTRSGVMSSFNAPLMQFRSDNMRLATSATDFDFRDLRKKKMTIYIGITPDQLANAKLILNIFWQQLLLTNTKELPQANPELKHSVMLMMDEFTASGYLPTYLKAISFIAGYGLRSVMIYQSNSQLEMNIPDGYGKEGAQTLLTNHACQIYYAPREQADAEKISKILGNKTANNKSHSYSKGGTSQSESAAQRALMLPQELREMPFEKEIITIDAGKPILCKKAFYYNDEYFTDKFKSISPILRNISKIPNKKQLDSAIQAGELRTLVPTQDFTKMQEDIKTLICERIDEYEK